MKTIFAFCVLSSLGIFRCLSQPEPADTFARLITAERLREQLSVIASAAMEGRETGTEGQRKAAAYIESEFSLYGISSPQSLEHFQQDYGITKDTLIPRIFTVNGQKYHYGTDYLVTPGSGDNDRFTAKDLLFLGYGISDPKYDDYAGKDVTGKVLVIFPGEPMIGHHYLITGTSVPSSWGYSIAKKAMLAAQRGAAALLFLNPALDYIPSSLVAQSGNATFNFDSLEGGHTKVTTVYISPALFRNIFGSGKADSLIARGRLHAVLSEAAIERKAKIKLAYRSVVTGGSASNVIGYVEGSDKKEEYVFLTAHYDHLGKKGNVIYYGADDDGSGTASVIEMARAFAKAKEAGFGPRRTVVFMTFSGEEKGLWGSSYYSDHPVFPLDSTDIDLNTDMIGRIDPNRTYGDSMNYVYIVGDDKISRNLKSIAAAVNKQFIHLELDHKFNMANDPDRIFYRSDHYNFARKGVPIIFFFDGIHHDYHQPTDTVDKINFGLMEKRARLIFLTAWAVANQDQMLSRDIPLPPAGR